MTSSDEALTCWYSCVQLTVFHLGDSDASNDIDQAILQALLKGYLDILHNI